LDRHTLARQVLAVALFLLLNLIFSARLAAQDYQMSQEPVEPPGPLVAVSYVTGWALDPTGYHPAILVEIENAGASDLSGKMIRFQGMFTDVREGQVVRARDEIRKRLPPRHRTYLWLQANAPFQLPIDVSAWPRMDCKVMYRVGDVGDEGTRTLLVTSLKTQAITRDDAVIEISKIPPFSQTALPSYYQSSRARPRTTPSTPPKPLAASAGTLTLPPHLKQPAANANSSVVSFLSSRAMPGIGDDFYEFEKLFGLPAGTDAKAAGWTWALYKNEKPAVSVFTGSRGQTGKVDVLVVEIPGSEIKGEAMIDELGKSLSGKLKGQKLGQAVRSVRYLPAGRTQFVTRTAPGYRFSYLTPRGSDPQHNTYVLMLSRVPGAIDTLMADHTRRSPLLRPLSGLFGAG
jgi:hypothetical protein